jgi:sec-independent protein translocase protein TatC
MAEEPGDDREERESTTSASDDSPGADDGAESPEERAVAPDDDGDAEAADGSPDADADEERGASDSEYFVPPEDDEAVEDADTAVDVPDPAVDEERAESGSEYFVPPGEDEPVSPVETDDDFNTLHAGEAGSDEAGSDEAGSDEAGSDEAGSDEAGSDEAGSDEAGSDEDGSETAGPSEDDETGGDLGEAYGMPSSNVTDEEKARWSDESDEAVPDDEDAELRPGDVPGDEAPADVSAPGDATANAAVDADAPASDGGYADESDPYATYEDYDLGGGDEPIHEGAPDDEEMPLADHIEEMVKRLGVVVIVMAVVSGIVFPFGEDLINVLWYSYLPGTVEQCPEAAATAQDLGPGDAACPRVYHPLAVILARLKVATLAGFLVALPVFVYETYLFMRPGLYPKERRYYLASVPTSLVLAAVGVAFAHFLVIPAIFTYFVYYSDSATTIAFGLSETFDLMILLMGGFAIVFQIPLFIMLALMMGLVTRQWMADRRLIFWGVYAGLAFLFSPDPTGMAPIIVAATMIALHEGTLLLAKWTGRK